MLQDLWCFFCKILKKNSTSNFKSMSGDDRNFVSFPSEILNIKAFLEL